MPRGSAPGERRGGRKKGIPNQTTQDAKRAIEMVAQGLGGHEGMLRWATSDPKNESTFWSAIYTRILPKEIKAEVDAQLTVQVVRYADDTDT